MFFHTVNAYEYKNSRTGTLDIHVDICCYDSDYLAPLQWCMSNILDPAKPFLEPRLMRYELPDFSESKEGLIKAEIYLQAIGEVPLELPRIAKTASTKPGYRYVYGVAGMGKPSPGSQVPIARLSNGMKMTQSAFFGTVIKTDWESGGYVSYELKNGESFPCEPIFVSNPEGSAEDDGIVLTIVINRSGTHSILVALDARDLKEIGRAEMPQVFGVGAHGTFVEDSQ